MRVLVTWVSKRGGTEGIGRILAEELRLSGYDVDAEDAHDVHGLAPYDAVVVGGALYANRWPGALRRFLWRNEKPLRKVPVWFFSSGPLDDSASKRDIPMTSQVGVLAERVGAKGHVTFGGRLERDAKGFPAKALAKTKSGDWRDMDHIRAFAEELADALPTAKPGAARDHPAHSLGRLFAHGTLGWALCAVTMHALLKVASASTALVVHAVAAPAFFVAVAWLYFGARGSRAPLPTALVWTGWIIALDLALAAVVLRSFAMFASFTGTWLPIALVFLATWLTGVVMSTMPWPKEEPKERDRATRGGGRPMTHAPS